MKYRGRRGRMSLPKLLNEKELSALFNALQNRKHKAMLFTAYSAGLRVSEIVGLKDSAYRQWADADIDSQGQGEKRPVCESESGFIGYFQAIFKGL